MKLSTGVMVLYSDEESFTLMTPQGHMFAGWITFSATERDGATVAQVQVLMRAADPICELGLDTRRPQPGEPVLDRHPDPDGASTSTSTPTSRPSSCASTRSGSGRAGPTCSSPRSSGRRATPWARRCAPSAAGPAGGAASERTSRGRLPGCGRRRRRRQRAGRGQPGRRRGLVGGRAGAAADPGRCGEHRRGGRRRLPPRHVQRVLPVRGGVPGPAVARPGAARAAVAARAGGARQPDARRVVGAADP